MINVFELVERLVRVRTGGDKVIWRAPDIWAQHAEQGLPYPIPEDDEEEAMATQDRPNPLKDAATTAGGIWAAIGGIVGALAMFGVLTTAQSEAIAAAGRGIPGVLLALGTVVSGGIPIITGLIAAFRTGAAARPNVTPVADPRAIDPISRRLVPLVPLMTGRHALRDEDQA